jgi:hypothetical protein
MPAKDAFHEAVKRALLKDGWQIQADQFHLKWGKRDFYIDLAAQRFFLAQKGEKRIAVEIKSFSEKSVIAALEQALGQFLLYRSILKRQEPERKLYLAISEDTFLDIFEDDVGTLVVEDYEIPLLVFDHKTEVVVAWKETKNTAN